MDEKTSLLVLLPAGIGTLIEVCLLPTRIGILIYVILLPKRTEIFIEVNLLPTGIATLIIEVFKPIIHIIGNITLFTMKTLKLYRGTDFIHLLTPTIEFH